MRRRPRLGRTRGNSGLLIINADDWGGESSATDAILASFEAGGVSSTTAMVHMADSRRAAEIAIRHGFPVGLHLNLTLPFDEPTTPAPARQRQARVVELVAGTRAHWSWRPGSEPLIRRCVADQLTEFERLYGRAPTHLDGHNHVHLSPNVLLAGILTSELPVRRAQNWPPRTSLPGHLASAARAAWTARFRTTDVFTSIRAVHPRFGGKGFEELLERSRAISVEIMTHPQWHDELELLSSPEWRPALSDYPLGSFEDLATSEPAPAGAG
jgi:predicted glycoside hydrolase/deacetylase ChbG (UPF0249 family)